LKANGQIQITNKQHQLFSDTRKIIEVKDSNGIS